MQRIDSERNRASNGTPRTILISLDVFSSSFSYIQWTFTFTGTCIVQMKVRENGRVWARVHNATFICLRFVRRCQSSCGTEIHECVCVVWCGWAQNTFFIFLSLLFLGSAETWHFPQDAVHLRDSRAVRSDELELNFIKSEQKTVAMAAAAASAWSPPWHKTNEFVHDLKLLISRSNWSVRVAVVSIHCVAFFFFFLIILRARGSVLRCAHLICIESRADNVEDANTLNSSRRRRGSSLVGCLWMPLVGLVATINFMFKASAVSMQFA